MMTIKNVYDWLERRERREIAYSLNRIETVLRKLNNPQDDVPVIHIAGTNGKGSVSSYLTEIFTSAGLTVGAFQTPVFGSVREQLILNGEGITEEQFVQGINAIAEAVEETEAEYGESVSPFEIMSTLTYYTFARLALVDVLVVEAGMGGRYDATNVVSSPAATVITNVALDHEAYLGDSLIKIAEEKSGIIKQGVPVFTAAEEPALSVIHKSAAKKEAYVAEIRFHILEKGSVSFESDHQYLNAVLAMETALYLQSFTPFEPITAEVIQSALRRTILPGRFEKLSKYPEIILDTAHNPAAVEAVIKTLKKQKASGKLIIYFGVMKDKAIAEMVDIFMQLPEETEIYWVHFNHPRAAVPTSAEAKAFGIHLLEDVWENELRKYLPRLKDEDRLLIIGSHEFAARVRHWWFTSAEQTKGPK